MVIQRLIVGVALAMMLTPYHGFAQDARQPVIALDKPKDGGSLTEVLAYTWQNHPLLKSERANARAVEENLAQAKAGYRPNVFGQIEAGVSHEKLESDTFNRNKTINPHSLSLQAQQPLYRGGRTKAGIAQAEQEILTARQRLRSVEQRVMLQAITAYVDLVQSQSLLALNSANVTLLAEQKNAASERFNAGEITRTDVAQADSRLARAEADRITADGQVASTLAAFERATALAQGSIVRANIAKDIPPAPPMPITEEEALTTALQQHPDILASIAQEAASRAAVRVAKGSLYPEVSLVGETLANRDSNTQSTNTDSTSLTARVQIPLYQSGSEYATIRRSQQLASARRLAVDDTREQISSNVIKAWNDWQSARASRVSIVQTVKASEIALDGVKQESMAGLRTVLDVLDANQELLDARTREVQAHRNEVVNAYTLMAAFGALEPKDLGFTAQE